MNLDCKINFLTEAIKEEEDNIKVRLECMNEHKNCVYMSEIMIDAYKRELATLFELKKTFEKKSFELMICEETP